jgi:hypothetical protein
MYCDRRPIVIKLVLFFYCFEWLLVILNLFFVFKVISILNKNVNVKNKYLLKTYSVMKWYPIIQTFIQCVTTINRLYGLFSKNNSFVLMILHAIFDSSQGIFIIIVFLFIPENKNNLKVCCSKIFSNNKNNDQVNHDHLISNHTQSFTASDLSLFLHSEVSPSNHKDIQDIL